MYSTPVGKGFNLIAILSGLNPEGLPALSGASLSGELTDDFKIRMNPTTRDEKGELYIDYQILPAAEEVQHGQLEKGMSYH